MAKKISGTIGMVLAYIQSFIDKLFMLVFKGLKNAAKESKKTNREKDTEPNDWKAKTMGAMRKSASFIGEVGDSFYSEYQKLKAKDEKENKGDEKEKKGKKE